MLDAAVKIPGHANGPTRTPEAAENDADVDCRVILRDPGRTRLQSEKQPPPRCHAEYERESQLTVESTRSNLR